MMGGGGVDPVRGCWAAGIVVGGLLPVAARARDPEWDARLTHITAAISLDGTLAEGGQETDRRARPHVQWSRSRWCVDQGRLVHVVRRPHCEAAGLVAGAQAGSADPRRPTPYLRPWLA